MAMHSDLSVCFGPNGVVGIVVFRSAPFVFVNAGVIVRVNDCEFALGEGDSAESIAVAEMAVRK